MEENKNCPFSVEIINKLSSALKAGQLKAGYIAWSKGGDKKPVWVDDPNGRMLRMWSTSIAV